MSPSPTPGAPRNFDELKELLKDDEMVKVAGKPRNLGSEADFPGVDVDGVLRGKIMSKSKFLSAAETDFGFCGVVYGWDCACTTSKTTATSSERCLMKMGGGLVVGRCDTVECHTRVEIWDRGRWISLSALYELA